MSTTPTQTPAAYLYGLPEPIQEQLARIAREAAGMDASEKGYAAALFATVAEHFATGNGADDAVPGAHMVSALGVLLRMAHNEATRTEVA
ncbi:hypothetical protein ABKW28_10750 [Nocardioides sp. 31GB23]|uniref:hypothetical protein n=1 Tax=Nocardioides sp. 31GB23 TaxID=3156065 RepID=UPI0032AEE3C0